MQSPQIPDLVCLSHLRWNFVFQRPQHLMSRFARGRRVFFIEEPMHDREDPRLEVTICPDSGVHVTVPHLPPGANAEFEIRRLLEDLVAEQHISAPILWFYTPMALGIVPESLQPAVTVYDCMDELSLFRGAPARLLEFEEELLKRAELVFTGGVSLYEAKRRRHPHVYPFPSGVDVDHFMAARSLNEDLVDYEHVGRPRIGYAGVIDERIDLELIDHLAAHRPDWQLIMIGPLAKIAEDSLPKRKNIHWLGMKSYRDLPNHFAGWDAAIMPFGLNESTRFISPTKTPEYLAAGLPVVSTAITDVVRPYGEKGLVRIGYSHEEFAQQVDTALREPVGLDLRERIDEHLQHASWDAVWQGMSALIQSSVVAEKREEVSEEMASV